MTIAPKAKRIGLDFFLNIVASGIMTVLLQLAVYPYFAYRFSEAKYGVILTAMGIVNTFIGAAGNALNNARLVRNNDYEIDKNGDFNLLLLCAVVATFAASALILTQFLCLSPLEVGLLLCAQTLGILRTYYAVAFRVILNFSKILLCNLCISAGYALGLVLVRFGLNWVAAFLCGELLGLLYLSRNSFAVSLDKCLTPELRKTAKIVWNLAVANLIANAITYLDRLLIMPLLGSENVAVFSVASVFGKTAGMAMLPIAGVLLGYFAQRDFAINRKIFLTVAGLSFLICATFYGFSMALAAPVLRLLYPKIAASAAPFLWIANLSSILTIFSGMISPVILKYGKPVWPAMINGVYGILFCSLGYALSVKYGLIGFCWASLSVNLFRAGLCSYLGWRCVGAIRK